MDTWNAECARCGEGCSITDMVGDGHGHLICRQCSEQLEDETDG